MPYPYFPAQKVRDMALAAVARELIENFGASSKDWKLGDVVKHPDGHDVKIIAGCYLDPSYGRVSNYWSWRRVRSGVTYGPIEKGYGW